MSKGKGYGVPLMTLTEREGPDGGRMLSGRLGDAIVVGIPLEPFPGGPQRWKLTLLQPDGRMAGRPTSRQREQGRGERADRARAVTDAAARDA